MFKKLLLVLLILLFSVILVFGFVGFSYAKRHFFVPVKSENGLTNLLILGLRGGGGTDADLTDTILFASVNQNSNRVSLIPIPRDLWIETLKAKINTTYHYGKIPLTLQTVEEITGQPVHYYFILSFDSFKQIIDSLGGVTVDVQTPFTDQLYPIAGREADRCGGDPKFRCRYETISFTSGPQLMNGERALKYVRSRHADGEEGTDFARSARQERLLAAIKNRISSKEFYSHPENLLRLAETLHKVIDNNLDLSEYGSFLMLARQVNWDRMTSYDIANPYLNNPKNHYSKQWVLVTKSGNWLEIQDFIKSKLNQ